MSTTTIDVIDVLAGISPGSKLDAIRRRRPETRDNAQACYVALLEADTEAFGRIERLAVAAYVAGVSAQEDAHNYYSGRLESTDIALAASIARHVAASLGSGPYGRYPAHGPLASESLEGARHRVNDPELGNKLCAALAHAHLLVFRPREAAREDLLQLLAAGWNTDGIVSLSQLVSFLNFQVRVIAGLHLLSLPTERNHQE